MYLDHSKRLTWEYQIDIFVHILWQKFGKWIVLSLSTKRITKTHTKTSRRNKKSLEKT